ncbi:hypothetical protein EVAR_2776_1 [Eumeta japonica]|uniref:Uncharacterized protein n=1 Tax=Eumeta variegata TaxID=151549 RepID=A0A4C1T0D2_EUMVA|nr:hypothetical protein EVAR_2776_1 [Eumeta japonica]
MQRCTFECIVLSPRVKLRQRIKLTLLPIASRSRYLLAVLFELLINLVHVRDRVSDRPVATEPLQSRDTQYNDCSMNYRGCSCNARTFFILSPESWRQCGVWA